MGNHNHFVCSSAIDTDAEVLKTISLLEKAILNNQIQKVQQLLRLGAEINFCDSRKRTPLMAAVETDNPELCEFLIKRGAKLELRDCYGRTAYLRAARVSKNPDVLSVLEKYGCNVFARDDNNDDALFSAAEYNTSLKIVNHIILKHDVDDNRDLYNYTPLMVAAHFNPNPEIIKTLLLQAEDYDLVDKDGCTAFMHSAYHNKDNPQIFMAMCDFLKIIDPKKYKERLMKKRNDGKDMLDIAIDNGNIEVALAIENEMKK